MAFERPRTEPRVIERWNRVFEVLSAESRRRLVASLLEAGPTESVALPEAAQCHGDVDDQRAVTIRLHHRDLPLLADGNYVDWSREPFCASRGNNFDELAAVIEAIETAAPTFPEQLVGDGGEDGDGDRLEYEHAPVDR
ncbi:hypothetical protein [Natronosalvus halobius]|uniref:hypothetical protein n=1 Tax=Natronosalvus halobius TaxID=2953746 RepID=UPI0020A1D1A3|nr:hypothetical protein [Natronosalvus halobius]USZ71152.1 hypothetical protein NGM15_13830 [Natronosalvus halobius]